MRVNTIIEKLKVLYAGHAIKLEGKIIRIGQMKTSIEEARRMVVE